MVTSPPTVMVDAVTPRAVELQEALWPALPALPVLAELAEPLAAVVGLD
jgi:hypothetical protein